MKFGVQLYNFRKELSEDFKGTLQRIAEMGFEGVEMLHYRGPETPEAIAQLLKDLNLECAGCMYQPDVLTDVSDIAYQYAAALNSPAVTISLPDQDFSVVWQEKAELFKRIGDAAAANGTIFSFHNHWMECMLADGEPALCRMLDATDPAKVYSEPDICWLTRGRIDPAQFIRRYAKRIKQVHFKDILDPDDRPTTAPLGSGVIDLKGSYAAACDAGVEWIIYEQDFCSDAFECAEQSLKYLKTL